MAHEIGDLIAVGLNHHTAPLDVRERLALDDHGIRKHLNSLLSRGLCEEAFMVSTCNRVELYGVPYAGAEQSMFDYFCSIRGAKGVAPHLFRRRGRDAVVHLFRVAASLDSLVLGEPQILGQVKTAVRLAEECKSLGRLLRPLTRRTLNVAKRVRTQTDIGNAKVGIGSAGVDLAKQIFGELAQRRAMLVGVGEMGMEVANALQRAGLEELIVVNRTFENAVRLANDVGGTPVSMDRMAEYLPRVDIVLTATGSGGIILSADTVRQAVRTRKYKPLFLMDLAVPRNVDPSVDDLDAAYLFNIDDLSGIVEQGRRSREVASVAAQKMVEAEADSFFKVMAEVELGPTIQLLRQRMENLRLAEIQRSKKFLDTMSDEQREELERLTTSLIKKVLHGPLRQIRTAGRVGDADQIHEILALWDEDE